MNLYLDRYAWPHPLFPDYQASEGLKIIIVIPAFDEPKLEEALQAIAECDKPQSPFLVLVVINESENAPIEVKIRNETTYRRLKEADCPYDMLVAHLALPSKKAGVGLARKVGMDEALRIFRSCGQDVGVMVCFDADCTCQTNYLTEVENTFLNTRVKAAISFFEHPLDGLHREQILKYECFLRYYTNALRYAQFPLAYQTLGSCISVRASVYEKQGGMNTRHAGEDFYFLNKIIPLGGFVEINTTTIYPSDRISRRVPFGTGKAILDLTETTHYQVYNPLIFDDMKTFFRELKTFYDTSTLTLPNTVEQYLKKENLKKELLKLPNKVASSQQFQKSAFLWFNAFRVLKFVHFARDHFYPNISLEEAIHQLFQRLGLPPQKDLPSTLITLRKYDRNTQIS